jgi:hypothetical protein
MSRSDWLLTVAMFTVGPTLGALGGYYATNGGNPEHPGDRVPNAVVCGLIVLVVVTIAWARWRRAERQRG